MFPINKHQLKIALIIALVGMGGLLGIDIHLASLPHIMHDLQTSRQHMQLSVALYILGLALSLLVYGPLSDKYGRKPIIIFGISLAALSSFLAIFTQTITPFLLLRFLQGIGCGACSGLARTMMVDVLPAKTFVTIGSYFSIIVSLSPLLAPTIGGYLQHYFYWQANFIFLSGFLLFTLLLYVLFCPETNYHKNSKMQLYEVFFSSYLSLIKNRIFVAATCIAGVAVATNVAYATTSSFILQNQYHVSPVMYGWLTTTVAGGIIVGKLAKPFLTQKLGLLKTILVGVLMILFAGLWILFFTISHLINVPLIMVAVFITLFSQPFIMSNTIYYALHPFQDKRGAAGALFGSFNMLLTFIVSAGIGFFPHEGVELLGGTYCLLGIIGFVVYFILSKSVNT